MTAPPGGTEDDYLHRIERLARAVAEEAAREGWLAHGLEGQAATRPLERAVNELATELRYLHHAGDGCADH